MNEPSHPIMQHSPVPCFPSFLSCTGCSHCIMLKAPPIPTSDPIIADLVSAKGGRGSFLRGESICGVSG